MKVVIKCSDQSTFTLEDVDPALTIEEFKKLVESVSGVESERQRLIYAGKILRDSSSLDFYGVKHESTVHLVPSGGNKNASSGGSKPMSPSSSTNGTPSTPTAAPSAASPGAGAAGASPFGLGGASPFGGMPSEFLNNPEMMQQMMNNPMVNSILSNPEFMQSMMTSNPQIRALIDQHPEIAHVLNDPSTMRQYMEMMRNPALMREFQRNMDMQMRNVEMHPEGFNAISQMYHTIQEPLERATQNMLNGQESSTAPRQPSTPTSENPNSDPLPNPWGPRTPSTGTAPASGAGTAASGTAGTNQWGNGGGFGGMPGMPDMESLGSMAQGPQMRQMLQWMQSNPEMVRTMLRSSPLMQQMTQNNPQMQQILENDDMFRQLFTPENMQSMMQLQQSLSGAGLNSAFNPWGAGGAAPTGSNPFGGASPFAAPSPFGAAPRSTTSTPTNPTPPPAQTADYNVIYATQLSQMHELGFYDDVANIRALQQSNGNVQIAINRLFDGF